MALLLGDETIYYVVSNFHDGSSWTLDRTRPTKRKRHNGTVSLDFKNRFSSFLD